jgi:hypothetical protein
MWQSLVWYLNTDCVGVRTLRGKGHPNTNVNSTFHPNFPSFSSLGPRRARLRVFQGKLLCIGGRQTRNPPTATDGNKEVTTLIIPLTVLLRSTPLSSTAPPFNPLFHPRPPPCTAIPFFFFRNETMGLGLTNVLALGPFLGTAKPALVQRRNVYCTLEGSVVYSKTALWWSE